MTQKMLSEVEAVKRERAAFIRGVRHITGFETSDASPAAKAFYPLPKVSRPRVRDTRTIFDDGTHGFHEWAVIGGVLHRRLKARDDHSPFQWRNSTDIVSRGDILASVPTVERIAVWSDLLANPDEVVDAEDES